MNSLKKLATLLKELEELLVVCMKCGMCQAVCPLYFETKRETDVARGKLAILDGLANELLNDPKGVEKRLKRCLLCGSCAAQCPSGVRILDIFIQARTILATFLGLSPIKKIIFRRVLSNPHLFDLIIKWGALFERLFLIGQKDTSITSLKPIKLPIFKNRNILPFNNRPFLERAGRIDTSPRKGGLKVGFFVGCIIDKIFPHIGEATLGILSRHGLGILIPKFQACCGIPAISSGDITAFKKLIYLNLDQFPPENIDLLITSCATCTFTIKKLWPLLVKDEPISTKKRIFALSQKTMDISELIVNYDIIEEKIRTQAKKTPVTYHDPCHLRKSLNIYKEPRRLIEANQDYKLVEMSQPERCCGMGGSFNIEHYDLSLRIGMYKRDDILATKAKVVVTSCPACMIQLYDIFSKNEDQVEIRHVIEIYSEGSRAKN